MISLTIFFFIFLSFQVQTSPDKFIQNGHFLSSFQKWPLICNMAVTLMLGMALLKKNGHFGFAGNGDKNQTPQNLQLPVIPKRPSEVHGLEENYSKYTVF